MINPLVNRHGTTDTVLCEDKVCFRVRNHGEELILSVSSALSDEQLVQQLAAYLKWRRNHPPAP
jgi:hypothetical protein